MLEGRGPWRRGRMRMHRGAPPPPLRAHSACCITAAMHTPTPHLPRPPPAACRAHSWCASAWRRSSSSIVAHHVDKMYACEFESQAARDGWNASGRVRHVGRQWGRCPHTQCSTHCPWNRAAGMQWLLGASLPGPGPCHNQAGAAEPPARRHPPRPPTHCSLPASARCCRRSELGPSSQWCAVDDARTTRVACTTAHVARARTPAHAHAPPLAVQAELPAHTLGPRAAREGAWGTPTHPTCAQAPQHTRTSHPHCILRVHAASARLGHDKRTRAPQPLDPRSWQARQPWP